MTMNTIIALGVAFELGAIGGAMLDSEAITAVRTITHVVDDGTATVAFGEFRRGLADGGPGVRIRAFFADLREVDGGTYVPRCMHGDCEGPFSRATLDACEASFRANCIR